MPCASFTETGAVVVEVFVVADVHATAMIATLANATAIVRPGARAMSAECIQPIST
jgi:hypothetical protein